MLSEKEQNELFTYTYLYAIRNRHKLGIPITEYFLLHYDEFIPNEKKNIYDKTDKELNIIFVVIAMIITTIIMI